MSETFAFFKPKLTKRAFVITKEDTEVGQLTFNGLLRPHAHATFGEQQWNMAEKGFLATKVGVTQEATLVAEYCQPMIRRVGSISVEGQVFMFGRKGKGRAAHYAWTDNNGQELVTYAHRGSWKKPGIIVVAESITASAGHQMLIPLGLFLTVNTEDAAVVVA